MKENIIYALITFIVITVVSVLVWHKKPKPMDDIEPVG